MPSVGILWVMSRRSRGRGRRLVASFVRPVRVPTARPRMNGEAVHCWNSTLTRRWDAVSRVHRYQRRWNGFDIAIEWESAINHQRSCQGEPGWLHPYPKKLLNFPVFSCDLATIEGPQKKDIFVHLSFYDILVLAYDVLTWIHTEIRAMTWCRDRTLR